MDRTCVNDSLLAVPKGEHAIRLVAHDREDVRLTEQVLYLVVTVHRPGAGFDSRLLIFGKLDIVQKTIVRMQILHAETLAVFLRLGNAALIENAAGEIGRNRLAAQQRVMIERRKHNAIV